MLSLLSSLIALFALTTKDVNDNVPLKINIGHHLTQLESTNNMMSRNVTVLFQEIIPSRNITIR